MTVQLVAHGVDTLYLNVCYAQPQDSEGDAQLENYARKGPFTLDSDLAYHLDDLKSLAKEQEQEIETPWKFQGAPLMIHPYGTGKGQWLWLLTSPLLNMTISHGRLNGIIAQVRLASQYLWSCAWCGDALSQVHSFLIELFGDGIFLQMSEVHLCADIAGWTPQVNDWQERFISRAISDASSPYGDGLQAGADGVERRWKEINCIQFGQVTGRLHIKIYDKYGEIERKSKKYWMHGLWKQNGWDGCPPVFRIEARYKRAFLNAAHVEWAYDFLSQIKELWAYAVGHVQGGDDGLPDGWLRLAVPGTDSNRARWQVDPAWKIVQGAFEDDEDRDLGALIFKQEKEQNIKRLVQQISGCASSLAAQGADFYPALGANFYDTMEWITHAVEAHLKLRNESFSKIVAHKRLKLVTLDEQ